MVAVVVDLRARLVPQRLSVAQTQGVPGASPRGPGVWGGAPKARRSRGVRGGAPENLAVFCVSPY